jgi:tripartite-type tricarboxylate transporter receptor subunit TctC
MSLSDDKKRKRYAEDPEYRERILAAERKRYAEDEEYRNEKKERNRKSGPRKKELRRQKRESDPEFREQERKHSAKSRFKLKYGLTQGDYDRMLLSQRGVCAICEQTCRWRLCVDHCHCTKQVRGLLCMRCNTGLGQFRDDPRLLRKAAAYLDAWRKGAGSDTSGLATQPPADPVSCDQLELFPPGPPRPTPAEPGARPRPREGLDVAGNAHPAVESCPSVPCPMRAGRGTATRSLAELEKPMQATKRPAGMPRSRFSVLSLRPLPKACGTRDSAKSAPPGLFVSIALQNRQFPNVSGAMIEHTKTDLTPVALVADQAQILIARRDLPADNLRDFIAYAKANPKLAYGSAGIGSASHACSILLTSAMGTNLTHVPYRGSAPVVQDLQAGRLDFGCEQSSSALPHIQAGTIKAIAVLARERIAFLPELPTAREQGLLDVEAEPWFAYFLPKATPEAIVNKLHAAAVAAMNAPAVAERLQNVGVMLVAPERRSPRYLGELVASEIRKWGVAIKASGVSMD